MKIISHRRNTLAELRDTPSNFGIEVDIRSNGQDLVIHHDPFVVGEPFTDWFLDYRHGPLILNVKEEGLEGRLIDLMKSRSFDEYFFLDQSFPHLIKWSRLGEHRCAVRVSEFESVETAMTLAGKVNWVWVDCFTHFPLTRKAAKQLQLAGFKLCIVSPELHGRDAAIEIPALIETLREREIVGDAVCTKQPLLWESALKS